MYFQFYDTLLSDDYLSNIGGRYLGDYGIEIKKDIGDTNEFLVYVIILFTEETSKIYRKLESDILKAESKEKQESLILFIINTIDDYNEKLGEDKNFDLIFEEFEADLKSLKSKIIRRFGYLIPIKNTLVPNKLNTPKIQWLGNLNLLTTLFYDLMYGQTKEKDKEKNKDKRTTSPLIKARKTDIANLLAENFIDSSAEPLSASTLSDYLSSSGKHSKNKLQKEYRIELPEK